MRGRRHRSHRQTARDKQRSVAPFAALVLFVAVCVAACSSSPLAKYRGDANHQQPAHVVSAVRRTTTSAPDSTTTSAPASTTTTLPPLAVVNVDPRDNARKVAPSTPVVITYNRPPGRPISYPTISPVTPGQWSRSGPAEVVFKPAGYWRPGMTYRVALSALGGKSTTIKFTTRLPSTLALQQYLAMLGYLPLRFTPAGYVPNRTAVLKREPPSPSRVPQVPTNGVFTWAFPGVPTSLWAQWHRGQPNVVTEAAVMQFEIAEGLAPDGDPGPLVWHALLKAVAERQMDTNPYDYVIVSESVPETLSVWQDGKFVFKTFTNTGVPGAATPQGTWPVAYKQNPNLMKGCDPNGPCYSVWVAYASYFLPSLGDAIHAYPRASYGYPQSNGCVEVPPWQGAIVYGYDPVGTLVSVTS
jgi:peptidoglycan hydrolase-like protein with peptidoglycan-binding domain